MTTFNMWNVRCMVIFCVACLCWITQSHAFGIHGKLMELQAKVGQMKEKALNTTEQLFRIFAALDDIVRATACPENFTRFESSCYYFSETLPSQCGDMNYARVQCQTKGSNLVSVETKQELDFIHIHTVSGIYWTSGHRHVGDYWMWDTTGVNLTDGYQQWAPGEPNKASYYCAVIHGSNGNLYDHRCSYTGPYICETKLPTCT